MEINENNEKLEGGGKGTKEDKYASLHVYLKKGLDEYKKRNFEYSLILVSSVATCIILTVVEINGSVFLGITNNIYLDIVINIILLDIILGIIVFLLFSLLKWDHNRTSDRIKKIFKELFKEERIKEKEAKAEKELMQMSSKEQNKSNIKLSDGSYEFLEVTKQVTVYKNRHGIIQFNGKVRSLKDSFNKTKHFISLDGSAMKNLEFKNFEEIKSSIHEDVRNRFECQTICAKIISIDKEAVAIGQEKKIEIEQIKDKGINEKKRIDCKILFPSEIETSKKPNKKFHENSVIEYTFGWSSHNLFPTKKEHLNSCEEISKEECVESRFDVIYPINLLKFVISFENGIKVKNVCIYRDGEKLEELKRSDDLYYTKYTTVKDICPCISEEYCIRWNF
ncbi:MAG: hypothetical protein KAQ87_05195 [Candidatus Pacebacteria bacterium]|nr:hypothetical protein [Candidatus Paceibacterota bacterium]